MQQLRNKKQTLVQQAGKNDKRSLASVGNNIIDLLLITVN